MKKMILFSVLTISVGQLFGGQQYPVQGLSSNKDAVNTSQFAAGVFNNTSKTSQQAANIFAGGVQPAQNQSTATFVAEESKTQSIPVRGYSPQSGAQNTSQLATDIFAGGR